jgi:hypothetical protein
VDKAIDRDFLCVDSHATDRALAELKPHLEIDVGAVNSDAPPLRVKLCFRKMADFDPEEIVRQVAELAAQESERLLPHWAGPSTDCQLVDEILHAPAFQKLEASWRVLEYLESRIDPRWGVQTYLLPLTKAELQQDLLRRDGVEGSVLWRSFTVARQRPVLSAPRRLSV